MTGQAGRPPHNTVHAMHAAQAAPPTDGVKVLLPPGQTLQQDMMQYRALQPAAGGQRQQQLEPMGSSGPIGSGERARQGSSTARQHSMTTA